jgi:hypothetical protein
MAELQTKTEQLAGRQISDHHGILPASCVFGPHSVTPVESLRGNKISKNISRRDPITHRRLERPVVASLQIHRPNLLLKRCAQNELERTPSTRVGAIQAGLEKSEYACRPETIQPEDYPRTTRSRGQSQYCSARFVLVKSGKFLTES